MGGELVHVRPYLRDQDLRGPAIYSWYAIQELNLLGERGAFPRSISMLNLPSDGLLKIVDVSQYPANHEAMLSGESSFQCFLQSWDLRAEAAPSQLTLPVSRDR